MLAIDRNKPLIGASQNSVVVFFIKLTRKCLHQNIFFNIFTGWKRLRYKCSLIHKMLQTIAFAKILHEFVCKICEHRVFCFLFFVLYCFLYLKWNWLFMGNRTWISTNTKIYGRENVLTDVLYTYIHPYVFNVVLNFTSMTGILRNICQLYFVAVTPFFRKKPSSSRRRN